MNKTDVVTVVKSFPGEKEESHIKQMNRQIYDSDSGSSVEIISSGEGYVRLGDQRKPI